MIQVYGIPNCNTVKKALEWLKAHQLDYKFHDYKKEGVTAEKLNEWSKEFGWEFLLNKKGTTWKALPEEVKHTIINQNEAVKLMLDKPSAIKRPVIEAKGKYLIRFDEEQYKFVLLKK